MSVTVPLNAFFGVMVSMLAAVSPCARFIDAGDAANVNPGGGTVTVSVIAAEALKLPDVP